jgi:hypothetical protein
MKTITKFLTAFILTLSVGISMAQNCTVSITSVTSNGNGSYTINYATNNFNPNSFFANVWVNFGDGTYTYPSPSAGSVTHTYSNNGMYLACITIDDSLSGCNASDCDTIYASTSPCNLSASFTTNNSSTTQYTFTDNSIGTYNNDAWNILDQFGVSVYTAANTNSITYTFTNNGFYSVIRYISDNSGGITCTDSTVDYIQISSPTVACSAWFYAWPDSANPGVVDIWDLSYLNNIGAGSYWDMGDGTTYPYTNGSFATTITHNYASSGFYNICLYINDGAGCADTFCTNVFVPRLNMNNQTNSIHQAIIHPNPNGTTGISNSNVEWAQIKACPNPCTSILNVQVSSLENQHFHLEIINSLGQTSMASDRIITKGFQSMELNTSGLENGLYILKISNDKNKAQTIRFIKN